MPAIRWILLASLLVPVCAARGEHFDSTGRIGVLCVGDTSYGESPILGWLSLDFAVQWQELPTDVGDVMTDEMAKKITRIYTPRSLERLMENYDFLLLLEPRMEWFSPSEMHRFRRSVELGLSSLLTLWPDSEGYLSLVNSELASVYPQDFWPEFQAPDNLPYRVVVKQGAPPVLTPFTGVGIERWPGAKTRPIHPRPGSYTWAWARKAGSKGESEDEYIISWEFQKGYTWVIGVDVDEQWFSMQAGNEYGGDIILNMLYYSVGKPLPASLELIHDLRTSFYRYFIEKKLLFGVLDFVDSFGANTAQLERKIAKAEQGRSEAERAYLEGDYDASYQAIKEMIGELEKLNGEAIAIKERALLWVYLTEWSAVSGTLVLAGFTLHSLMVKKRLYRQVSVTRTAY